MKATATAEREFKVSLSQREVWRECKNSCGVSAQKKEKFVGLLFLKCHIVPDYRTFIEDYLKIVEFIEWLKDFYPEKAAFLTKNA